MRRWPSAPLAEVASFCSGGTPSKSNAAYWDGDVPWLSAKDLKSFWLDDSQDHITQLAVNDGARMVPSGALLILIRGMTLMKEVPVGVTRCPVAFNQDVKGLIPDKARIYPEFLGYHILTKNQFLRGLVTQAGHGTGRLSTDALAELEVPLPPLSEQRKIVEMLNAWEQWADNLQTLVTAKKKRLVSLRQQILDGTRRFPQFKNQSWVTKRVGDLLKSVNRYDDWDDNRIFKLAGVRRNSGGLFFRSELLGSQIKVKVCKKIQTNDFLISRRQITWGGMSIVPREFNGYDVNDEYEVLCVRDGAMFDMRFFQHLSHTAKLKNLARLASNGVFAERLRLNFDLKAFLNHFIRIPSSKEEQLMIVSLLDACAHEIRLLEAELEALKEQKRGLMEKLLTGKVRVKP